MLTLILPFQHLSLFAQFSHGIHIAFTAMVIGLYISCKNITRITHCCCFIEDTILNNINAFKSF